MQTLTIIRPYIIKHRFTVIFGMLFGILLYSMMMTLQLTNAYDGSWYQNYHFAGFAELTSGRWMLHYVDKITAGLHADPIASIIALGLFVLGFVFILELFHIESKKISCLCMALWLSSTVICNTLSYRYTSIGYGISFLFAALGAFVAIKTKHSIVAILSSGTLICLSFASYQAYIAVFCIVALFYILHQCARKTDERSSIFKLLVRISLSAAIGAIFYLVSLFFLLKLNHASLSSYNGADSITAGNLITNLPQNILKTYQFFGYYFLTGKFKINWLQHLGCFYLLIGSLFVLVFILGIRTWRTNKRYLMVYIPTVLMIPVACSAYGLIAGDVLQPQMTAGLAILIPLIVMLALTYAKKHHYIRIACMVFAAALLYGNTMQVWIDQEAMYEGRNASSSIATQVIADLRNSNMLSSDYEYYFVGTPARNRHFEISDTFYYANAYAQMGNFWTSGNCLQMSYHGLISKWMGFDLPMSMRLYEDFMQQYDVSAIPSFPNDGYITEVDDGLVVIKISEYEPYFEYALYPNEP